MSVAGDLNNFGSISLRGVAATSAVPIGSILSVAGRLNNEGSITLSPQTSSLSDPVAATKLVATGGISSSGIINVRGRGASIESLGAFSTSALLIVEGGGQLSAENLSNTGYVRVESADFGSFSTSPTNITTQIGVSGLLENSSTFSIETRVWNSSVTSKGRSAVTVSELSNLGAISLSAASSRAGQTATSILTITNSYRELQSGVLTAGTLSLAASAAGTSSEIYIPESISRIGSAASISLTGANSHIRRTSDQSDALATLQNIDGRFSLTSRSFSPPGDFNIGTQGTLNLASGANFQIGAGKVFESDGLLQMNAGSILSATGEVLFGDDSLLKYVFTIGAGNTLGIGNLTSMGEISLAGDLSLNFSSITVFAPLSSAEFTLLKGALVSGEFANVADGDFIDVLWNGALSGRFQLDYRSDRVVLTNFQSVPEPSTMVLLVLAAFALCSAYGKHASKTTMS